MLGRCVVHTYSEGQAVIALSSGEAEYYGLVTGVSQALGIGVLAQDWGVKLRHHVWMDATAGMAIGSRRGLGRVKHTDTVYLWVQEVVNSGRVTIGKKDTKEMLVDILTKPVAWSILHHMLESMGYRFLDGRHQLGYKA